MYVVQYGKTAAWSDTSLSQNDPTLFSSLALARG